MPDYCSFFFSSRTHGELPENLFRKDREIDLDFTDNDSPARRASFERLAKSGIVQRANNPRYRWSFDSNGRVQGFDVHEHILWLLDRINPDFDLRQLKDLGYEYELSYYWESNGTGAGPLVTPQIAKCLADHDLSLQFGFYFAPADV